MPDPAMAEYAITYFAGRDKTDTTTVRAAYATGDEKLPGMIVFKDSEHKIVALVSAGSIATAIRSEQGEAPGEFQPTSQIMKRAVVKPERF